MGWTRPTAVFLVAASLLGGAFALSSGIGANASCGNGTVNAAAVSALEEPVAGYSGDQLTNAAAIMNAAAAMQLTMQAQTIGVMTAMGESTLHNLDRGDTVGPDSRGLFQQRDNWGSLSERMNPGTAATLFFTALTKHRGWESMTPSAAAHAVQRNADPDHYTPYYVPAVKVVQALTATTGGSECAVGGDAQALAQQLVTAADEGQIRGLIPDHIREIRWIAQGKTVPNCSIDTRVLQIMVLALHKFHTIGIGDINRKCTGQIAGAGTMSSHWIDGGSGAVDFFSLGGTPITGADGKSLRMIGLLEPVMPAGARIGQSNCRTAAGVTMATTHFTQYADACNHLHIDVAYTDEPLVMG